MNEGQNDFIFLKFIKHNFFFKNKFILKGLFETKVQF
jgi:hypothetical protein